MASGLSLKARYDLITRAKPAGFQGPEAQLVKEIVSDNLLPPRIFSPKIAATIPLLGLQPEVGWWEGGDGRSPRSLTHNI